MKRFLLLSVLALFLNAPSWAYDFSAVNDDGVTIYYNYISDSEVMVTYRNGYYAYSGDVDIPETVTHNGVTYTVTSIGYEAFCGCTNLTRVVIPNSVTEILDYSFYECTGLVGVNIPNGVTKICEGAFYKCTGLTSMTIPESVTEIGKEAFYRCSKMKGVTIPENVTTIGEGAFYNCSGLTGTLTIPENMTTINADTFYGCSGLTEVTIPNSVTEIGEYAFYGCTSLKTLTLEDGEETLMMTTSSYYTPFTDCPIKTLYMGRNVSHSGAISPFEDNPKLVSLTIGESVTEIGTFAFEDCTGLKNVIIPNSVEIIDDCAFYGCTGLTRVSIGSGVFLIRGWAFYGCTALERIYSLNPDPPTCEDSEVFEEVPTSTCTLYVPKGTKEVYSNAKGWRRFLNIKETTVDAVADITTNGNAEAVGYYTTDGKKVSQPRRGNIYIIRYSDGTAKKVLVK